MLIKAEMDSIQTTDGKSINTFRLSGSATSITVAIRQITETGTTKLCFTDISRLSRLQMYSQRVQINSYRISQKKENGESGNITTNGAAYRKSENIGTRITFAKGEIIDISPKVAATIGNVNTEINIVINRLVRVVNKILPKTLRLEKY